MFNIPPFSSPHQRILPELLSIQNIEQHAVTGTKVAFCVVARVKFQWQKDGMDLDDDHRICGSDTNTLSIQSVQKSDKGCYSCLVKNAVGSKHRKNFAKTTVVYFSVTL